MIWILKVNELSVCISQLFMMNTYENAFKMKHENIVSKFIILSKQYWLEKKTNIRDKHFPAEWNMFRSGVEPSINLRKFCQIAYLSDFSEHSGIFLAISCDLLYETTERQNTQLKELQQTMDMQLHFIILIQLYWWLKHSYELKSSEISEKMPRP